MPLPATATTWIEAALGFLYPPVCQLCNTNRATANDGYVCGTCFQRVRFIKPPFCERCGLPFEGSFTSQFTCSNCTSLELHFSTARSAVIAKDAVLDVIHRYKYNRALWFEPFLAGLLTTASLPELAGQNWDAIVPVPLHPTKEREREFNQAARLGHCLSQATGIPLQSDWLRRVTPTRTQTLLTRAERADNVRQAFAARAGLNLSGKRVIVLDDVFTTGATTSACARTLRTAGAGNVCVWTVARGV